MELPPEQPPKLIIRADDLDVEPVVATTAAPTHSIAIRGAGCQPASSQLERATSHDRRK